MNPKQVIPLPDQVSDGAALSMMVQGITAYHILKTVGHFKAGESVVVHAGAGGVGSLAIQLAKLGRICYCSYVVGREEEVV